MMKSFLAITFFFISMNPSYCQDYFSISDATSIEKCAFDSTLNVNTFLNWEVFQTIDADPYGIRDSVCHNISSSVSLSEFDLSRPVYIRLKKNRISVLNLNLAPNAVYSINYIINASLLSIKDNANCDIGTCSNIAITTRNLAEDSLNFSYTTTQYIGNVNHNGCILGDDFCFETSKLDSQAISDILITVYFEENIAGNATFSIDNIYGNMLYDLVEIREPLPLQNLPIVNHIMPIRLAHLANGNFFDNNFLVIHNKNGYPNALNYDEKTISISPNPTEQTTIVLKIDTYESLFFQEYTGFGTSLVEGSDSLYHKLNIIQDGGNMCIQFVDLQFDHDVEFKYRSGDLSFSNKTACMAFRQGSAFTIMDNANLNYGENGNGMLGLINSRINIEKNGHLLFDGTLILNGKGRSDSEIHLGLGSSLSFTENAKILNVGLETETIKVFAYENQVHLHNLTPEDRNKIVIVEPEIDPSIEKVWFFPNPSSDIIQINAIDNFDSYLFDALGKCIQIITGKTLEVRSLPKGIYYLISGTKFGKLVVVD